MCVFVLGINHLVETPVCQCCPMGLTDTVTQCNPSSTIQEEPDLIVMTCSHPYTPAIKTTSWLDIVLVLGY